MPDDLEIARRVRLRPIAEIATKAGIPAEALEPYGRFKAKIGFDFIESLENRADGALVLVTGINPTAAGEGKTTTAIGLADALNAIGKPAMLCLREPSLGPCFGVKGGATGGGRAQIAPMEEINLHFTGDFHAITAANNLLAAMLDNHLHYGNALCIDTRRVFWRRAFDVNDRSLRATVIALGSNGPVREDGFDITAASEVMALFCLARNLPDLEARLARIVVAERRDGGMVTARDLRADGAMAALLRDALMPNLVQTLEGSPVLVHGGPFANIAHGCNSVMATRLGLKLAPIVVTEAGFGADLGAEKFFDIKCRLAGLTPAAAVVVATVRALKLHGGAAKRALETEDVGAVERGIANLARHVENVKKFGVPVLVALNSFTSDTAEEIAAVKRAMAARAVEMVLCTHWADGAAGAAGLARAVIARLEDDTTRFAPLYPDGLPFAEKIRVVAREIYHASDIEIPPAAARRLASFEQAGFAKAPVCIAKTQYSFSADPARLGAPEGHVLPIRAVQLSAGAGFVVALAGEILTMPGLPRVPASEQIGLGPDGKVSGLF
ncbi:MAG TPA: formate--tetrahydrofolate ligase [Acetobacteraceae bacterium]|nr:formate--tetrahydrofolate ligase [Acetobacteraceae bacterium]